MFDLAGAGTFEGNVQNALGLLQMLRILAAQVAKEAVNRAQAHIARADLILPSGFQTLEKSRDLRDAELFHGELASISFFPGSVLQQEFKAVAVALKGKGTEGPLTGPRNP